MTSPAEKGEESRSNWGIPALALAGVVVGGGYLLNLFGGQEELIGDEALLWGNLDEAAAAVVLWCSCRYLFSQRPPHR